MRLLAGGLALLLGQAGCADSYLIPSGAVERLRELPQSLAARTALPAIRDRDAARTWVRARDVDISPVLTAGSYQRASEHENRRRVSALGLTAMIVGALGLGTGLAFIGTQSACTNPGGALPCISGTGDAAVTLTLAGALLLFGGTGLQAARALEVHPSEVQPSEAGLFFLAPSDAPTGKTPIE